MAMCGRDARKSITDPGGVETWDWDDPPAPCLGPQLAAANERAEKLAKALREFASYPPGSHAMDNEETANAALAEYEAAKRGGTMDTPQNAPPDVLEACKVALAYIGKSEEAWRLQGLLNRTGNPKILKTGEPELLNQFCPEPGVYNVPDYGGSAMGLLARAIAELEAGKKGPTPDPAPTVNVKR
jgi:hypothetical protein